MNEQERIDKAIAEERPHPADFLDCETHTSKQAHDSALASEPSGLIVRVRISDVEHFVVTAKGLDALGYPGLAREQREAARQRIADREQLRRDAATGPRPAPAIGERVTGWVRTPSYPAGICFRCNYVVNVDTGEGHGPGCTGRVAPPTPLELTDGR